MQILFVSPCFHTHHYGGVQGTARLAWEAITTETAAPRLLCYGPRGQGHPAQNGNTVHAHSKLEAALRAFTLGGRPDVVLVWHLGMLKLLPFLRTGKNGVVLFLHGIECWRTMGRATQSLLERVGLFLTNSDFTWRRFVENHPRFDGAAHRTVALGIGSPGEQTKPAEPPAALIIGRMARSEDYKGHRQLIQVWRRVLERLPEAQLWIVGGGDLEPDLKALARSCAVRGRVRFYGSVSDDEKNALLASCRCLVMPSRGEGFGLVYLEAMRLGRPCLVSTTDAGQEVVRPPEAGLAVDPEDSPALASAVVRLMTPGADWTAWSSQARRRYESGFTAKAFQRRLVEALP